MVARDQPGDGGVSGRPLGVFLLPGLFGDEPQLRSLRERLDGLVHFTVIDLPDIEAPQSLLSSVPAIGTVVAEMIDRRQPAGPVSIAGFSFGASVALETATQLVRAGRTVCGLYILDGGFKGGDFRRSTWTLIRLASTPRGAFAIAQRISQKVCERLRLAQARLLPASLSRSQPARKAYIAHFRGLALDQWEPEACLTPGVMIASRSLDDGSRWLWSNLCPNLRIVSLQSEHGDLLKRDSLDRVVSVLSERFGQVAGVARTLASTSRRVDDQAYPPKGGTAER